MAKAVLQVWSQCHHNCCRWVILFNTEVAVVFFLAAQYRLFMSPLIRRDQGELEAVPTLATILVGTARKDLPLPRSPSSLPVETAIDYLSMPLVKVEGLEPMGADGTHPDDMPTLVPHTPEDAMVRDPVSS